MTFWRIAEFKLMKQLKSRNNVKEDALRPERNSKLRIELAIKYCSSWHRMVVKTAKVAAAEEDISSSDMNTFCRLQIKFINFIYFFQKLWSSIFFVERSLLCHFIFSNTSSFPVGKKLLCCRRRSSYLYWPMSDCDYKVCMM